jgi:hypothetical protein
MNHVETPGGFCRYGDEQDSLKSISAITQSVLVAHIAKRHVPARHARIPDHRTGEPDVPPPFHSLHGPLDPDRMIPRNGAICDGVAKPVHNRSFADTIARTEHRMTEGMIR